MVTKILINITAMQCFQWDSCTHVHECHHFKVTLYSYSRNHHTCFI